MGAMRWILSAGLTLALAAPALAAPLLAPQGRSLATATGDRLFPLYAGEALPGWLDSFNGPAMRAGYRGMPSRQPLPGGRTLAVLRHEGLVGAYVFQGDRCIGQLLFEPFLLADPEPFVARLAGAGRPRAGFFATSDRRYALDATTYERRLGALVERRVLVALPMVEDGRRVSRPALALEAIVPADLLPALAPLLEEGQAGVAAFWREHEID